jgi:multisubunit Na+/H+ antiporter MnhB subunit
MLQRAVVLIACGALGVAVAIAMLQLPAPSVRLAGRVDAELGNSGVTHAVTAVLLNFRGYDTLLEIAVLMLALLGVLVTFTEEKTAGRHPAGSPQAVMQSMARLLAPLMVLVAGYLLWAGAHRPGGAFQAGAVLAACIVLLHLSGLLPDWSAPGRLLRAGLVCGFLIFLVLAAIPLWHGALLQYPVPLAGALMMTIETGLTLSLGLILAGLFLWLPDENEEPEE